jgi:hypothetical protein
MATQPKLVTQPTTETEPKLVTPPTTETPPTKEVKRRAPENETPRERFRRVAGNRLTNALKAIELLGNLGLSTEYEYTGQDVQKIVEAISGETKKAADLLTTKKPIKQAVALFD